MHTESILHIHKYCAEQVRAHVLVTHHCPAAARVPRRPVACGHAVVVNDVRTAGEMLAADSHRLHSASVDTHGRMGAVRSVETAYFIRVVHTGACAQDVQTVESAVRLRAVHGDHGLPIGRVPAPYNIYVIFVCRICMYISMYLSMYLSHIYYTEQVLYGLRIGVLVVDDRHLLDASDVGKARV